MPAVDATISHARERLRAGIDLDPDVNHLERVAEASREHADCRAAACDVAQHLGRDGLGKRADAFVGNAVIGNEDRDCAASGLYGFVMANCRVPAHEFLEIAEAARRLG